MPNCSRRVKGILYIHKELFPHPTDCRWNLHSPVMHGRARNLRNVSLGITHSDFRRVMYIHVCTVQDPGESPLVVSWLLCFSSNKSHGALGWRYGCTNTCLKLYQIRRKLTGYRVRPTSPAAYPTKSVGMDLHTYTPICHRIPFHAIPPRGRATLHT